MRITKAVWGWTTAGIVGSAALMGGIAGAVALSFARAVVSPPTGSEYDVRIITSDLIAETVTLSASADTLLPGVYSLISENGASVARVGAILGRGKNTVTRHLLTVDKGSPRPGTRARISGWYYVHPSELGYPVDDVQIHTELGEAPAWLVSHPRSRGRWAIHVHGRGVQRVEAIRGIPPLYDAGYTSLAISYRNDGEAPSGVGGHYALGDSEWRDVESAMNFAVAQGATDIVLVGWSMGGATVMQALLRSRHRERVRGVILESPVVDWYETLRALGRQAKLPPAIQSWAFRLLKTGRFRVRRREPINLDSLNLVKNAGKFSVPVLLLHSDDDGFVISGPSREFADARPDLVTFVPFTVARHTKLWNYDRARWTEAIRGWLKTL